MKEKGFTLIELVVVIVVLGILAVTAAPRFLNLQQEANVSTITALKGAINGANNLVHSKAVIDGLESESNLDPNEGVEGIGLRFGYVRPQPNDVITALNLDLSDWVVSEEPTESGVVIQPLKKAQNQPSYVDISSGSICGVHYHFTKASPDETFNSVPTYDLITDNC